MLLSWRKLLPARGCTLSSSHTWTAQLASCSLVKRAWNRHRERERERERGDWQNGGTARHTARQTRRTTQAGCQSPVCALRCHFSHCMDYGPSHTWHSTKHQRYIIILGENDVMHSKTFCPSHILWSLSRWRHWRWHNVRYRHLVVKTRKLHRVDYGKSRYRLFIWHYRYLYFT